MQARQLEMTMSLQLPEMLKMTPKPDAEGDGTQYIFKPSLIGGAWQFDLTDRGLAWQIAGKSGTWPLQDIAGIRLSYRPVSMQAMRFRADIENSKGGRVVLYSTTRHTVSMVARQDGGYRAFIVELHRRLKASGSKAVLIAGINPLLYCAGVVLMALVGLSIAALFVRALWIGEWAGALFLAAFGGWFVWQIGGFMKRNRPRTYTFDALPMDVLP